VRPLAEVIAIDFCSHGDGEFSNVTRSYAGKGVVRDV
jgi:hypothetical protein